MNPFRSLLRENSHEPHPSPHGRRLSTPWIEPLLGRGHGHAQRPIGTRRRQPDRRRSQSRGRPDPPRLVRHRCLGLATAFRLQCVPAPSGILAGQTLADRMASGPIGLFGRQTSSGRHALAVHGLHGDFASALSTLVWGVDPRGYAAINMDFYTLQTQFAIEFIVFR